MDVDKKRKRRVTECDQELMRLLERSSSEDLSRMVAELRKMFEENAVGHGIIRTSILEPLLTWMMECLRLIFYLTRKSKKKEIACFEAVILLMEIREWCSTHEGFRTIDSSYMPSQYR